MVDFSSPEYIHFFRHSSPYINAHRGKTFVLMLSGEAVQDNNFANTIHDIALLNSLGVRLVLVIGARPQIDERLAHSEITCAYYKNIRVTDKDVLEIVKDAVGNIRTKTEAMLSMGLANSPMHNARIRVISGNFVTAKPLGVLDGIDFQHTGEVRRIDNEVIHQQLDQGYVVLLNCLGSSPTGEVFNLAAEDVATQTAIALKAEKLIVFGKAQGVYSRSGQLLKAMTPAKARVVIQEQENEEALRLMQSSLAACAVNVKRSHIISHSIDGALLQELFTRDGSGTLITHTGYEEVRQASIEDIGGVLELIQPLEEQGILVRRSRKQLEREINQFMLIERDGMTIGCASIHAFTDDSAELACFAIHSDYRGHSHGDQLLTFCEEYAINHGIRNLFVLTTRTAHWFLERGFQTAKVTDLPEKKQALYNFQRNSKVFVKKLK
ncbi:amino-acid N-acetyltransferase [Zooshikella sp. RANM57]|uniref:amino-acid N-acetyltransferase n=1 Tax=Zooshikella sp. RANM57 TaxID=3425863 RepID=UPI003D6F32B9